ncbi:cell cycle protein, FtsW/RodA/SpoVE family [Clostridiales bacterium oral taxon 876 str. F0540]|nr:cell cycle protein, FtsW/RodA/SpoVE family [Clostridiales bacterium oral taxon 876 str. F0540]
MGLDNRKIEEYINNVCTLVKNKDAHSDIKLELKDHLELLKEEAIQTGLSEEDAIDKAIAHMGDSELVGKQLNKTHKAKLDLKTLIPVLSISLFGLLMMYFIQTNSVVADAKNIKIFEKSLVFYSIGTVLMIGLYIFDYRKLFKYSKYMYAGTIAVLVLTSFFGVKVNGIPYLNIGFAIVNFTDISPFFLVIALAGIFEAWNWDNSLKALLGIGIMFLPIILLSKISLSTAAICIVFCSIFMIVSKARRMQIIISIAAVTIVPYFYIIVEPYRSKRMFTFLNPSSDPQGMGWLYIQLHKTLSSAGFLGNGFNLNPRTIPDVHTDFVFAYIVYSFGWLAAIITIIFIAFFIIRMMNTAKATKYSYGKLLVIGFAAAFTTQFILSIATNLGFSPLFGVTMPFMSFGGSHIITDMMSVGLILSVYRRKNLGPVLPEERLA